MKAGEGHKKVPGNQAEMLGKPITPEGYIYLLRAGGKVVDAYERLDNYAEAADTLGLSNLSSEIVAVRRILLDAERYIASVDRIVYADDLLEAASDWELTQEKVAVDGPVCRECGKSALGGREQWCGWFCNPCYDEVDDSAACVRCDGLRPGCKYSLHRELEPRHKLDAETLGNLAGGQWLHLGDEGEASDGN